MSDLVRIDEDACQAWLGDKPLKLQPKAFQLLQVLVANAGRILTRERIMQQVWDATWMDSKTLANHVLALRRALGDDAARPAYITSVRGVGLRFEKRMVAPIIVPLSASASAPAPERGQVVEINGARYEVLLWQRHPGSGPTAKFTLYAQEVS